MSRGPNLTLVPPEGPLAAASPGEWLEAWRDGLALGWRHLDAVAGLYDPRRLRAWWLAELSRMTSDFMRSPQFFALMRFNLSLLAPRAK
jgi:hypothetical protein